MVARPHSALLALLGALLVLAALGVWFLGNDPSAGRGGHGAELTNAATEAPSSPDPSPLERASQRPHGSVPAADPGGRQAQGRRVAAPEATAAAGTPLVPWTGTVVSRRDGSPLAGVSVSLTLPDLRVDAQTDERGAFQIGHPSCAAALVELAHHDFVDQRLPAQQLNDGIVFQLEPSAAITGWLLPPTEGAVVRAWLQAASSQRYWVEHETLPDADGRFRLGDLTPGEYVLAAEAPERAVASRFGLRLEAGETLEVELRALAGGTVRGVVRDAGSEAPVAGAEVRFEARENSLPSTQHEAKKREVLTDASGHYEVRGLGPGPYTAAVYAPGGARDRERLVISTHGQVLEQDFVLPRAAVLGGRVVDAAGEPVSGVTVIAFENVPQDPEQDTEAPRGVSGRDGAFTIEDVRGEGWITLVGLQGERPPAVLWTELPEAGGVKNGLLLELPPTAALAGRVVSPEGDPVVGATLRAEVYYSRRGRIRADFTETDPEGRFALDAVAPGRVRLSIKADDFLDTRRYLDLVAGDQEEEIVLDHAYTVVGYALDEDGAGVDHLPVRLLRPSDDPDDDDPEVEIARTDAYGFFRFHDIPAGVYRVEASSYGWELERADPDVVVVPTERELELEMVPRDRPERFAIRGVVDLEGGGTPERLSIRGLRGGHLEIDGSNFLATGLTPSRHRLVIGHPGHADASVGPIEPLPGKEVDVGRIVLEPATLVTVRVRGPGGQGVDDARVAFEPLPLDQGGSGEESSGVNLGSGRRGRYQGHVKAFAWRLVVRHPDHDEVRRRVVIKPQEGQGITVDLK